MALSLNCYLLGDDPDQIFTVKVSETDNVSTLKDLIKEKNAFALKDVDAKVLKIWRVDLAIPNLKKSLDEITFDDTNSLSPVDVLSDVFLAPTRKHVHVIIESPTGQFLYGT